MIAICKTNLHFKLVEFVDSSVLFRRSSNSVSLALVVRNSTNLNSNPLNGTEINQYLDGLVSINKLLDVSNPSEIETGKIKGVKELID
jgi:hypothetical protein